MGFSFVYRMQDETGAPASSIVRAYMITRSVLNMDVIWRQIEALDPKIDAQKLTEIMMLYVRLLRRVTRWFLRTQRMKLDITKSVKMFAPAMQELKNAMPSVFGEGHRAQYEKYLNQYIEMGIPESLASEITITRGLFAAMDVLEISQELSMDIIEVAQVYFNIGEFLDLAWIRTEIISHSTDNHWEALSREALRDDLDWQQRQLTAGIIRFGDKKKNFMQNLEMWAESHAGLIERWRHILTNLRSSSTLNYTMFFVAIRELLDLTQTTIQVSETKNG
jgi:glutamate dehydrogenase